MDKEDAKKVLQNIPFIEALAQGKTVQERRKGEKTWIDTPSPMFFSHQYEHRIKPEPRKFFLCLSKETGNILAARVEGKAPIMFAQYMKDIEEVVATEVL